MAQQLSDKVAQEIMGEIDTLTKRIDGQIDILNASRVHLIGATTQVAGEVDNFTGKVAGELQNIIDELPGVANAEMKRAGNEAVAALSSQVGRIARRIAADSATADRQKSFYIAAGVLSVFACLLFGAGIMVGSHSFGVLIVSALALAIGVVAGMVLTQFMITKEQNAAKETTKEQYVQWVSAVVNKNWTTLDFERIAAQINRPLTSKMLAECRSVLVDGVKMDGAPPEHGEGGISLVMAVSMMKIE